jgi:hypothetical protein
MKKKNNLVKEFVRKMKNDNLIYCEEIDILGNK